MNYSVHSTILKTLFLTDNGKQMKRTTNSRKKAILIPQPTTGCELTLRTKNKIYSAILPEDLTLESETSCELLLIYDSRVGIGKISSSIS